MTGFETTPRHRRSTFNAAGRMRFHIQNTRFFYNFQAGRQGSSGFWEIYTMRKCIVNPRAGRYGDHQEISRRQQDCQRSAHYMVYGVSLTYLTVPVPVLEPQGSEHCMLYTIKIIVGSLRSHKNETRPSSSIHAARMQRDKHYPPRHIR